MRKRPDICLSLNCKTIEEVKADIDEFGPYCRAIEWCADRFEGIENYSQEEFTQVLRLIKTMCRGKRFFFDYKGEGEVTNRFLRYAMGTADYIDIIWENRELKQLVKEARRKGTKTLVSYHAMDRIMSKEEVATQFVRMERCQADIIEIVAFADREEDAYALLEGADAYNQLRGHLPFIALAMGKEGQASRICAGDFGSAMTYGCGKKPTAPGQFNARDLSRYMDIYYRMEKE